MIRELRTYSTEQPFTDEQWALIESLMETTWANAMALAEAPEIFVAALGDPFDGMKLYGPFTDSGGAIHYAESVEDAHDWHVAQVWPVE